MELLLRYGLDSNYLAEFLIKHFDEELCCNRLRKEGQKFEWNLTYNFYTYENMRNMIRDIEERSAAHGERPVVGALYLSFCKCLRDMMASAPETNYISVMGP